MTRTHRRIRTFVPAVLACLALSSCGLVGNQSEAFSVDGHGYPRSGLNDLVRALSKADQLNVVRDQADGNDVRSVINVMVQYKSGERVLERMGIPVTDAERQAVAAQFAGQLPPDIGQDTLNLLADISATGKALDSITPPSETDLKSLYESSPASTGMLCIREISVKTRDQAVDVVTQLADGADFASLARKVSLSKATKTAGGAVTGTSGGSCLPVAQAAAESSVGNPLALALLHTPLGHNTGAVQDRSGWHVAVHRPFAEVKDTLVSVFALRPGRALAAGVLATADIRVNPVYGTWNPVTSKVE